MEKPVRFPEMSDFYASLQVRCPICDRGPHNYCREIQGNPASGSHPERVALARKLP